MEKFAVIDWTDTGAVRFLDQTRLPGEELYREVDSVDGMVEAIKSLRVRGAPLIGIAAAMGLAAATRYQAPEHLTREWFRSAVATLRGARPTAVNLSWALDRMVAAATPFLTQGKCTKLGATLRSEAQRIWDEDVAMCAAIAQAGVPLVPANATIMTHCNAGALATGGIGTALGVVYAAQAAGKSPKVVSCETRPLRQGARLTSWELARSGIPVTAIADSAAATVLAQGKIDLIITGADRITTRGDVANKIGTYGLAVLARAHRVPFYVAAPRSTFDAQIAAGLDIPIEERGAAELEAASGATVFNPAFDVTPAEYLAGIVTDQGLLRPPFESAIHQLLGNGE